MVEVQVELIAAALAAERVATQVVEATRTKITTVTILVLVVAMAAAIILQRMAKVAVAELVSGVQVPAATILLIGQEPALA
jgi:hypothetical protein